MKNRKSIRAMVTYEYDAEPVQPGASAARSIAVYEGGRMLAVLYETGTMGNIPADVERRIREQIIW